MEETQYGYRLLIMAAIIGINAFFASAETALVSVRPSRLRTLAGKGNVGAQAALSLLAHPERLLSVVQVGVTLTSLALGWVGESTLYQLLLRVFDPVITPGTRLLFSGISVAAAFTVMTFAHVVVGEVVPKNLAIDKADRLSVLVAPVLLVFYRAVEPFVWVIERSSTWLSRRIGVESGGSGAGHSAEELKFIVTASQSSGHISTFERDAISNLIELQYFAVREVMVPRNSLVMVEVEADIDDVLQVMSESGYSRLPVYDGDRENILGIVHVKDVLAFWTERRQSNLRRRPVAPFDLRRVVRKVPVVPETKALHEVMDELRARHAHVAFVVDEFGTITGFLSMEDVIEQVFGEIEDEFDPMVLKPVGQADTGVLEVDGLIPIRDLLTQHKIELPDDLEVETLAGFLLHRLGRIPAEGDEVEHESRRYTVIGMDHNRVAKVRIEALVQEAEGTEAAGGEV